MARTEEILHQICSQFQIEGDLIDVTPYGEGHIHATFAAEYQSGDGSRQRFLLQRINRQVFPEPETVMENIQRVTDHLRRKISARGGTPQRHTLTLIPTRDGRSFFRSDDGEYWRAEAFIEGCQTYRAAEDIRLFFNAARAFGEFQKDLADFPVENLHITIPDFHHTVKRFERFEQVVRQDGWQRAARARLQIDFALRRAAQAGTLTSLAAAGTLPERVTHNDAKLDNILMDGRTGEAICVIDLDTVMAGLGVFDFGDLVRSGANTAAEDERDLSRVTLDLRAYDQIAAGFLEGVRGCLSPAEIDQLPFAARLITFEQGLRFLTDYLEGDRYYHTRRPGHNLERCQVQFKLLAEMEANFDQMVRIVESYR